MSLMQQPLPHSDIKINLPSALDPDPRTWSRQDVVTFLRWCENEFELPGLDIDKFQLNGKALWVLNKSNIAERAPSSGDVIHDVFHNILKLFMHNATSHSQIYTTHQQHLISYAEAVDAAAAYQESSSASGINGGDSNTSETESVLLGAKKELVSRNNSLETRQSPEKDVEIIGSFCGYKPPPIGGRGGKRESRRSCKKCNKQDRKSCICQTDSKRKSGVGRDGVIGDTKDGHVSYIRLTTGEGTTTVNCGVDDARSSVKNLNAWHGTIHHKNKSVITRMTFLDDHTLSLFTDLQMPKSMRILGTSNSDHVWSYLQRVRDTKTGERIRVFQFTPAMDDDFEKFKFFFDEVNVISSLGINSYGVIGDSLESKLPSIIETFFVVTLGKESDLPRQLIDFVEKNHRAPGLFLGVVVLRSQRSTDQSSFDPLPEQSLIGYIQSDEESDCNKIQATHSLNSTESPLVGSGQSRISLTEFHRPKLQQDIPTVKANVPTRLHNNFPPTPRLPSKSNLAVSPRASPEIAESNEDNEMRPTGVLPFNHGKPPVDGEVLMQLNKLEEMSRQIGIDAKHNKLTGLRTTFPSKTTESVSKQISYIEPPFTRSKALSKINLAEKYSYLSKRSKKD